MRKILLLSGMTPDRRIFSRLLPLLPTAVVVDWIRPLPDESIASYAARLSRTISYDEPVVVCGVSFGGIVARELSHCLQAHSCILISTVRSPDRLPLWIRTSRIVPRRPAALLLKILGDCARRWPRAFKSKRTWRATKLGGKSGQWHRWASSAVLTWRMSTHAEQIPVLQIHGDQDFTFPIRYTDTDIVVEGGGHLLPLTHSHEIAKTIQNVAA